MRDARVRDALRTDKALVVFSDVEMGAGGETDDFPHTAWFAEVFLAYNTGFWAEVPVDLVLNGDTFDLLKTSRADATFTHIVDESVALEKMGRVIEAHPFFFQGLREFLGHRAAPRRVVFTVGNHDFELLFPALQDLIRRAIAGTPENVLFPGFEMDFGDVHIEHGSQADPLFRMDADRPLLEWEGRSILNLPWGAVALVDVALPLHPILYPCDRARPHGKVLSLLPEVRAMLLNRYWQYWTRDWLSAWWSASDPVKHVNWTLFRQVASRLQSGDPSIQLDPALQGGYSNDKYRAVVLGHLHDAAWHTIGTTKVLRTGCMRDEFAVDEQGAVGPSLPKVYAELLLEKGKVFRSQLVEVDGPAGATATMPESIFEVLGAVHALIGDDTAKAQEAQVTRESLPPGDYFRGSESERDL
jgi:UDP-2,3-diacylglucosamine pyrophosphatase LpxH